MTERQRAWVVVAHDHGVYLYKDLAAKDRYGVAFGQEKPKRAVRRTTAIEQFKALVGAEKED